MLMPKVQNKNSIPTRHHHTGNGIDNETVNSKNTTNGGYRDRQTPSN